MSWRLAILREVLLSNHLAKQGIKARLFLYFHVSTASPPHWLRKQLSPDHCGPRKLTVIWTQIRDTGLAGGKCELCC
jgi:hypothetical protein